MAVLDLRLLATSDVHMHLLGHDYHAGQARDGIGLSRVARLIREARSEVANSLYFDNGDLLQGNPLGDHLVETGHGAPHPAYQALEALGCDAAGIGNHEFNYGLDFLQGAVAAAKIPLLCANVLQAGQPLFAPVAVLERSLTDRNGAAHALRIGVTAFCPPQIMMWDRQHLEGRVECEDIIVAARQLVPTLRPSCDLLVVLCHSGAAEGPATPGTEEAAPHVARIDGVDVVIAGHRHQHVPGPGPCPEGRIGRVPVVMPGVWGSHLGVIDLELCKTGSGWQVERSTPSLRATTGVAEDPEMVALIAPWHASALDAIGQRIGHSETPLNSYFAQVAPDRGLALIARAQAAHIEEVLAGTDRADLPVLSAAAAFKFGGRGGPAHYTDIPAGPISLSAVSDLYVFPNTIRAVEVTGAGLRDWIDRAASRYAAIVPGSRRCPLFVPEARELEVDILHGVSYRIDLSRPPRCTAAGARIDDRQSRVADLCFQGRPVEDDARFIVATNNYRAGGGSAYLPDDPSRIVHSSTEPVRDLLISFLRDRAAPPPPPAAWGFVPMQGTSVTFPTGPGARAHLDGMAGMAALDLDEEGFLQIEMEL